MRLGFPTWSIALLIAVLVHASVLLFFRGESSGAVSAGEGGIEIALAAGNPIVQKNPSDQDIEPELEPVQEEIVPEPEPEPDPLPEPIPTPEATPRPAPEREKPAPQPPVRQERGAERSGVEAQAQSQGGGAVGAQADYYAAVQAWLERHKTYPYRARSERQEGIVLLYFEIDRDGTVLVSRIEERSGYVLLDEATMDLIARASPLPKPPPEMPGGRISFILPIEYSLK